jgi:hypothetical protein
MAYSLETSSVKTIVPGAELSGFCDVVARQKINEVSGEVPQLSAGEGIDISTVDGKTVITNNISAGSNISLVYDMETNTYRIDSNAGGVSSLVLTASAQPDPNYRILAGSGYWGVQDGIEVTDSATNVGGLVVKTRTSARNADNYFDTDASLDSDGLILSNSHGRTQRTQYNKASLNINSSAVKYTSAVKSNPEGEPVVTSYSATWKQIIDAATATGGNAFPIVSSDDSTPQYKYIYELDGTASGIEVSYTNSGQYVPDWVSSTLVSPAEIKSVFFSDDGGYTATGFSLTPNGVSASGGWPLPRYKSWTDLTKPTIQWSDASPDVPSVYGSGALLNLGRNNLSAVLSNSGLFVGAATGYKFSGVHIDGKGVSSKNAFGYSTYNQYDSWEHILEASLAVKAHSASWANSGKTYTGVDPIQVNNTTNEISITGESLSAGPGIDMFSSGGYVVISSNGGNPFPITGTNGTTGFTANMDCSSMMLTTGASPAGGYVKQTVRGVQYEAYPATDVSASWYNIINAANNINVTCSAVKLTTAASENWFYTSALPNLNKITFIAPSYGPYGTYSALIDDGETTFVAEVDSGCCV